jgi:thiamine-phosphate diphosphorylase
LEEALIAQKEGADFITFGPIFNTPSKMKYGEPLGTSLFQETRQKVSVPVLGIGGMKPENIRAVIDAGADGVALISGILGAPDIKCAAKKYLEILGEKRWIDRT